MKLLNLIRGQPAIKGSRSKGVVPPLQRRIDDIRLVGSKGELRLRPPIVCSPTHPVFRAGLILRAAREIAAGEAVQIAEALRGGQEEITQAFAAILASAGREFSGIASGQESAQSLIPRVRLFPALTVDFLPLSFYWRDNLVEFRPCMTVCVGGKRAKIWTRYNFQLIQSKTDQVSEFFSVVRMLNQNVQTALLELYNKKLASYKNSLEKEYQILIRMLSTNNEEVRDLAAASFASNLSIVPDSEQSKVGRFDSSSEKHEEVLKILCNEFGDSIEPPASPDLPKQSQELFAFTYPSNSARSEQSEESGESERKALPVSDFNAISVINISDDKTEIIGLAYEQQPPENFRRSATHIISGEISFELGNAY
jgi:hypothetical protein